VAEDYSAGLEIKNLSLNDANDINISIKHIHKRCLLTLKK